MTKTEFLQQLYNNLQPLSPGERDDIIADFEEHFTAGTENGKTEEQICAELGNPYTCALQYLRQEPQKSAANTAPPVQPVYNANPVGNGNNTTAYYGNGKIKGNPQRNRTLWAVLFFVGVFAAIGIYPTAVGLMVSFFGLIIASAVTATLTSSAMVFGFLFSIGIMLFAAGLLMFLLMTWFLKLSWQRADL